MLNKESNNLSSIYM